MYKILSVVIPLLICAQAYALKPSRTYYAVPDTMKLPYEKNVITTPDNVKLRSWTFLPVYVVKLKWTYC